MSGHSKWHNIQKTKGAADAKRAQAFTKIAREMIVAVKEGGGGDPRSNSRLAAVIAKAKAANMPNDNIKRTIDKALGAGNTENYEKVVYEGYGPQGVAVIVDPCAGFAAHVHGNGVVPGGMRVVYDVHAQRAAAGVDQHGGRAGHGAEADEERPEDQKLPDGLKSGMGHGETSGKSYFINLESGLSEAAVRQEPNCKPTKCLQFGNEERPLLSR